VRFTLPAAAVLLTAIPISAQIIDVPAGLAAVELDRSRACVGVLNEVARIDVMLDPLGRRSRRLTAIAQAIAIEDRGVVASLDTTDAVELAVRDWFATDAVIAQRYVTAQDPAILELRASGRDAIKELLTDAAAAVQTDADSILDENQETMLQAGPCDGAILVRSAVIEACEEGSGRVCDEAGRSPAEGDRFRFVDTPESVWEIQEMRPWTAPATLGLAPTGQLEGGRTISYARIGNVVVTVALSPLLKNRTEVTPTELYALEQTNQALGIVFEHPSIVFAPAFGFRAALPDALAGETEYVIHFGPPDQPDTLWRGEADTGLPLEATIPMQATHVIRLRAGDQLSLTAMRTGEPVYTIPLDTINQVTAVESLLDYMSAQLSADLNELIKPVG
jgi:hypothetical protein